MSKKTMVGGVIGIILLIVLGVRSTQNQKNVSKSEKTTTSQQTKQEQDESQRILNLEKENSVLRKELNQKQKKSTATSSSKDQSKNTESEENEQAIESFLTNLYTYDHEQEDERLDSIESYVTDGFYKELEKLLKDEETDHNHQVSAADETKTISIENIKLYSYDSNDYLASYDVTFEMGSGIEKTIQFITEFKITDGIISEWQQLQTKEADTQQIETENKN